MKGYLIKLYGISNLILNKSTLIENTFYLSTLFDYISENAKGS